MMKIKKRTAIEALTAAVDLATAAEAAKTATTATEAVKKAATASKATTKKKLFDDEGVVSAE